MKADAADSLRKAGNAYYELGEPEIALSLYRRGSALTPGDSKLHHNAGVVLIAVRRYPEAVYELKRALALAPRSADTLTALGLAYHRMRLVPLARESLDQGRRNRPTASGRPGLPRADPE